VLPSISIIPAEETSPLPSGDQPFYGDLRTPGSAPQIIYRFVARNGPEPRLLLTFLECRELAILQQRKKYIEHYIFSLFPRRDMSIDISEQRRSITPVNFRIEFVIH